MNTKAVEAEQVYFFVFLTPSSASTVPASSHQPPNFFSWVVLDGGCGGGRPALAAATSSACRSLRLRIFSSRSSLPGSRRLVSREGSFWLAFISSRCSSIATRLFIISNIGFNVSSLTCSRFSSSRRRRWRFRTLLILTIIRALFLRILRA